MRKILNDEQIASLVDMHKRLSALRDEILKEFDSGTYESDQLGKDMLLLQISSVNALILAIGIRIGLNFKPVSQQAVEEETYTAKTD